MFKFDPKTLKPFLNGPEPQKLCSKYFFCKIIWIFVELFEKAMKGWFVKSEILCTEQLDRAKKKMRKKFDKPALLGTNISQIFFSHPDHRKYLLLFCSTGLSLFHILQQACQNSNWFLWKFYVLFVKLVILYQIFERKWNDRMLSPKYSYLK